MSRFVDAKGGNKFPILLRAGIHVVVKIRHRLRISMRPYHGASAKREEGPAIRFIERLEGCPDNNVVTVEAKGMAGCENGFDRVQINHLVVLGAVMPESLVSRPSGTPRPNHMAGG